MSQLSSVIDIEYSAKSFFSILFLHKYSVTSNHVDVYQCSAEEKGHNLINHLISYRGRKEPSRILRISF